jgi:hypothetical protein
MKFTGRPRLLTDEQICKLYLEGQDSETIAYQAQCSGTTVLTIVRRNGIEVIKRGGRVAPLPVSNEEVCRLYQSGQSGNAIAEALGTHATRIYKILDQNHVERRRNWQHLKSTHTKPGTEK